MHETIYRYCRCRDGANCGESWSGRCGPGNRVPRKPHRRPDARRQGCIVNPSVMISSGVPRQ